MDGSGGLYRALAVSAWRHVRAIGLLPGISAGVIPALIAVLGGVDVGWGFAGAWQILPVAGGATLIGTGLLLMYRTITLFARVGEGTLAPWDPPRTLVVRGPYRFVRNPMITGLLVVLIGEAALLGSPGILVWAVVFFGINMVWFPRVEEPRLMQRFGSAYEEYRRHVPRWVPRRTPWTPDRG
jgi:protein-S-isoprenylcysteine O-methyltransferase Ste14